MAILESIQPNLENEFLKGLRNRTVIGDIQNQVIKNSKILPHIQILETPGDVLKIIGLKSNRPKKFSWDYKEKEFGPGEAVVHKAEITDDDKLIFYTVFSEPIEKIAVGDKSAETIAKQTNQVSYDIADFYDEEFVQKYACDLNRYHKNAVVKLSAEQLQDIQSVGQILITTGYQMTSPSTLFNKRGERCNVSDTKKILCFVDYSLYGMGQVSSIYKAPSPVLEVLERIFTVIPCSMVGDMKAALIDSGGLYLWQVLKQRYLKSDEYVAAYKLLDHVWRKWIFVDYRPAFAIVADNKTKTGLPENNDDNEEKPGSLDDYLNNDLKEKLENFIKHNSGDKIKSNSKTFWKKVTIDLKDFDKEDIKHGLNNIFNGLNLGESDDDAKDRLEEVKKVLKEVKLIDEEEA